ALCGDDDALAPATQTASEDQLGMSEAIHIGGVEQRDAGVKRPLNREDALVITHRAVVVPTNGGAAKSQPRGGNTVMPAVLHGLLGLLRQGGFSRTDEGSIDRQSTDSWPSRGG